MNNFNVFKIKTNDLLIDNKLKAIEISKNYLKEKIKNYVEEVNVNIENMMDEIVKIIELEPHEIGDTSLSSENDKFIYQVCHMRRIFIKDDKTSKKNFNCIATTLSTSKETIYDNAVLICSKINEDGTCTPHNLTLDDVVNLYYSKITTKIFVKFMI